MQGNARGAVLRPGCARVRLSRLRALLTVLLTLLIAWSAARPALADVFDQAQADAARGDTAAARALLDDATRSGDARVAAQAHYQLGGMDEKDLAFANALAQYQAAITASPSFRYAQRAHTRIDALRAHSEGGFAPLRRLEKVRRDPQATSDPAAIDALARDADTFPDGPCRAEARMLAAEAYLSRLDRPADGMRELDLVSADASADRILRAEASSRLVNLRVAAGDLAGARVAAARIAASDPSLLAKVKRLERRRVLGWIAVALLAALAAFSGVAVARKHRGVAAPVRAFLPLALAYGLYLACVGAVLVTRYEKGHALPFFAFGGSAIAIALIARAWSAAGSPRTAARVFRALLASGAVVGAAFLLLRSIDAHYLDGFGL